MNLTTSGGVRYWPSSFSSMNESARNFPNTSLRISNPEKLKEEVEAIEEDQKRLRENIDKLKNTPEAKQLITRYIAKADAQETRLEQIEKEKKAAETEQGLLAIELAKAVREFKFDRKL